MIKFLLWIWQLPQNVIGFILTRKSKAEEIKVLVNESEVNYVKIHFTSNVFGCGVSLGNYIILDYKTYFPKQFTSWFMQTVRHEHGHQLQSKYLGWLYLPVVGITSALFNNLWDRLFHKKWSIKKKKHVVVRLLIFRYPLCTSFTSNFFLLPPICQPSFQGSGCNTPKKS